jgi:hypothetical protein
VGEQLLNYDGVRFSLKTGEETAIELQKSSRFVLYILLTDQQKREKQMRNNPNLFEHPVWFFHFFVSADHS